jgi:hypothetical protein
VSIDGAGGAARFRRWGFRLTVTLAAYCPYGVLQADAPRFSGRVVLELVEEIGRDHMLRVLEEFTFHDEDGRSWSVPARALLDGWSIPRGLHALPSLPLEGEFRKSGVVHGHFVHAKAERWRDVHRMLYSASLAEGIPPTEAKVLYMTIYASSWRWEPKGSSCYRSCHAAATMLAWRPDATLAELVPVAEWLQRTDPTLEEIEGRVDAALERPGPHLFTQLRQ